MMSKSERFKAGQQVYDYAITLKYIGRENKIPNKYKNKLGFKNPIILGATNIEHARTFLKLPRDVAVNEIKRAHTCRPGKKYNVEMKRCVEPPKK